MKLVKLMGGLGNQLFQYSFARYLEGILGEPVWLDTAHFLFKHKRNIELGKLRIQFRRSIILKYLWYRLNPQRFIKYDEQGFDPAKSVTARDRNQFFWGYWQKTEYALAGRAGILAGFSSFPKRAVVRKLAEEILGSDSLSIHVRRGDYRGILKFLLLSKDYYDKALDAVNAQDASRWYVFSDERGVEKELFDGQACIVRMSDFDLEDHEEFYLMSLCKRNIIANSTFSWWAAFLNERDGRRMAMPRAWYTVDQEFDIGDYAFDGVTLL